MKSSARGPFVAIRWYCKDGSILAARAPGGCDGHRGGYQHGEWSAEVKRLRAGGYYIANILADLDPAVLAAGLCFVSICSSGITCPGLAKRFAAVIPAPPSCSGAAGISRWRTGAACSS
jgi:hypothetical protein